MAQSRVIMEVNYQALTLEYEKRPELLKLRNEMGKTVADTVQAIGRQESASVEKGIFYATTCYDRLRKLAPSSESVDQRVKELVQSDAFFYGYYPPQFKLISRYKIQIKKGILPSVALEAFIPGREFAIMDCVMVCQIGQYQALYKKLKKEKFDKLFSHESGHPLTISGYQETDNPLRLFLIAFTPPKKARGFRAVAIGQRICFDNICQYRDKHLLLGEASSYHLVCLNPVEGKQRFVGLGTDEKGMTEVEVEQLMIDEYNKFPTSVEAVSDALADEMFKVGKRAELARFAFLSEQTFENRQKLVQILQESVSRETTERTVENIQKHARPLLRSEIREEGFGFREELYVIDIRAELIEKLVALPLEKVSMTFVVSYLRSLG